ncbi:hypothetical protein, partial [Streptomyces clavuligerus]
SGPSGPSAPSDAFGPADPSGPSGAAPDGPDGPDGPGRAAGPRWRTPVTVCAVLVLLLTGTVLLMRTDSLRDTPAARNQALTDTAATDHVADAVGDSLVQVLSYTPDGVGATRRAAGRLLAGKARRQYTELFTQVEKEAAAQRLSLTTHVVRTGVTRLTDRTAEVLVFLDQVARRPGRAPVTTAAQLTVTAERYDGRWLITGLASR